MKIFRQLITVRCLVLMLAGLNITLGVAAPLALSAPGDATGDCWTVNPYTGQQIAVNWVASPNNPIDCALPANTCKPKGNCEQRGTGDVRWTDAIKVGDCSKPNKNGNCQACPGLLTCAIGDKYRNANDCINQQNKLPGIERETCFNGNCCK